MVNMTDDDVMMAAFRQDYLALLQPRMETITARIEAGDALNARVALLSLETSSTMAGASGLASVVRSLRGALDQGEGVLARGLLAAMRDEAERVRAQLL